MFALILVAAAVIQAKEIIQATQPAWEKALNYGVLGLLILAFIAKEVWQIVTNRADRKAEKAAIKEERDADRKARHDWANALNENTNVTRFLSSQIKGMLRWIATGKAGPVPDEDTPPKRPAVRPGDIETR